MDNVTLGLLMTTAVGFALGSLAGWMAGFVHGYRKGNRDGFTREFQQYPNRKTQSADHLDAIAGRDGRWHLN